MKKIDITSQISGIDPKYLDEALTYRAPRVNKIKILALVACIAVLVTSLPLALILKRDDKQSDDPKTDNITDDIIDVPGDDTVLQSYENIQLKDGTLVLNAIKLSNGKIVSDLSETRPYVFDYTAPTKEELAEMRREMIESALKYHDPKYSHYPNTVDCIGSSKYGIIASDDKVSKYVLCDNHDNYSEQSHGFGNWDGCIYVSEDLTSDYVFTLLQDEICRLGEIFQKNFDSYHFYSTPEHGEHELFLWDSSDKEINNRIEKLDKTKYEGEGENKNYTEDYLEFRGLTVGISFSSYGYGTDGIHELDFNTISYNSEIYKRSENEVWISKLDYLSLNINGNYYRCGSSDQELYACSAQLEQYLIDVFKIKGLTDQYEVEYVEFLYPEQNNDVIGAKHVTIKLESDKDYADDTVTFKFHTLDGELYFLDEIRTACSIAEGVYIELIDEDTALKWLIRGYCIGNIGQFDDGCRICTSKYRIPDEELIPNGLGCSLVYIPEVVFVSGDETITYDMPFYEFTVPTEGGQFRVAYVPATEIEGLNDILEQRIESECVYRDHTTGSKKQDYNGNLGKKTD